MPPGTPATRAAAGHAGDQGDRRDRPAGQPAGHRDGGERVGDSHVEGEGARSALGAEHGVADDEAGER